MKTFIIGSGSYIYKRFHYSEDHINIHRDLGNLRPHLEQQPNKGINSTIVYYPGHSGSTDLIDKINYNHFIATLIILEELEYSGHFIYISSTITEVTPKKKSFIYYKNSRIFAEYIVASKLYQYTIVKIGIISNDKRTKIGRLSLFAKKLKLMIPLMDTYITYNGHMNNILSLNPNNQTIIAAKNEKYIIGKH